MTSKLPSLVLGAVVLSLAACGGASTIARDEAAPGAGSIVVRVENNRFPDAQVYVRFVGEPRRRLGTVTGKSTSTFTVRHRNAAFVFIVDYTGGGATQGTQEMMASPGDAFLLRAQDRQPLQLIRR